MKYVIFFLTIFFVSTISCKPQTNISKENLNFCVKDYSKNGAFLAVKVNLDSVSYPCIVRNLDMWRFFSEGNDLSDNAYERKAKSTILYQKEVKISNGDTLAYGFMTINLPSPITMNLKKGKEHIIEKYFQPGMFGGYIIRSSSIEYWPEIVYTLFIDYGVICNSYDESGYIHIPERQFAE